MSTSVTQYLGPFLQCKQPMRCARVYRSGCPNVQCSRYGRGASQGSFCAWCGTLLVKTPWYDEDERVVSLKNEFCAAVAEQLYPADPNGSGVLPYYDVFLPNVTRDGQPREFRVENDVRFLPVGSLTRDTELSWFRRAFAVEIAKASELYGELAVTQDWGLLRWYQ